jgi:type IV secretory pathway VirB10-like protein
MNKMNVFQLRFVLRFLVGASVFYPTLSYAPSGDASDPTSSEPVVHISVKPVKDDAEGNPKPPAQKSPKAPAAEPAAAPAVAPVSPKASDERDPLDKRHERTLDEYNRQEAQFEEDYKLISVREKDLDVKEKMLWDAEQKWDADMKRLKEDRERLKARQLITKDDRNQQSAEFDHEEARLAAQRKELDASKAKFEEEKGTFRTEQGKAFAKQRAYRAQFQVTMLALSKEWAKLAASIDVTPSESTIITSSESTIPAEMAALMPHPSDPYIKPVELQGRYLLNTGVNEDE